LEVTCPSPEGAVALVGAARRLGIVGKTGELRGEDRVLVRDGDAIRLLLSRMGAQDALLAWEQHRSRPEVGGSGHRLASFDEANRRRSTDAAAVTTARLQRALELLGGDAPEHRFAVARLRLEHGEASLEELGRRAGPPMTKDAVAGRIRRLLALANRIAHGVGIPDTSGERSRTAPSW
jgi:hypothetical protein